MSLKVVNDPLINKTKKCTSDYKTRNKKRPSHNGMDLTSKSSKNNYVIAIEKGTISSAGYSSSAGYYVYIKHENGYQSFYCHLLKNSTLVKKGQKVIKGEKIGLMGASGTATGVHLHFAVKNSNNIWIDPLPYLEGTQTLLNEIAIPKNGTYTILSNRNVYTSYSNKSTRKLVKELTINGRLHATSIKGSDKATLKKGTRVTVSQVVKNDEGHIWGKIPSGWICLVSNDGTIHIK